MKIQTSLGECGRAAVALLVIMSGADTVLGQQDKNVDLWMTRPSNLSLAVTVQETPASDTALTSVEQGKPNLDQAFEEFNEWRLEKRRAALEDTQFLINLRTFYFDRSDFTGAEKQAVAIGGWVGVKTGYFLDHIAFGATLFTTNPIYASDDREGTSLPGGGRNGLTGLGEGH